MTTTPTLVRAWWWTPREFYTDTAGGEHVSNDWDADRVPTMVHIFPGDVFHYVIPALCGRTPGDDPLPVGGMRLRRCQTCRRAAAKLLS